MEFLLVILIYGIPLSLLALLVFGFYRLLKLLKQKNKTYGTYIKMIFIVFFSLFVVAMFLPEKARYAISEYRLKPILENGTELEIVKNYLEENNIYYTVIDKEKCEEYKSYGVNDRFCEEIPNIFVPLPLVFSFIRGSIRVRIYFDEESKVKKYSISHSYTFL